MLVHEECLAKIDPCYYNSFIGSSRCKHSAAIGVDIRSYRDNRRCIIHTLIAILDVLLDCPRVGIL